MPARSLAEWFRECATRYAPWWVKIIGNCCLFPWRRARLKRIEKEETRIVPSLDEPFPVPPVSLRYRITGALSLQSFLKSGPRHLNDLNSALSLVAKRLADFKDILDFGCGCGRMLRALPQFASDSRVSGVEIDREAVDWCHRNLPFARVIHTSLVPPCSFEDAQFDLIYGISVFTHLSEELQFLWLEELRRILKPGGFMLQSVLDEGTREGAAMPRVARRRLEQHGFAHVKTGAMAGFLPLAYGTTYHTKRYIQDKWSNYFQMREYVRQGMTGGQSIVILQVSPE
jgi:SAM-dependent methyltransferase